MHLFIKGQGWGKELESDDHKARSQELHKKVSQQRARLNPKDQDVGMANAKISRACLHWIPASKSEDGVGYLNTQGLTTRKHKHRCEGNPAEASSSAPFSW